MRAWRTHRVTPVTSVREASFDVFRAHGMTTMFGNPGSTELPMLRDYPDDFRYVLGLQEAVVVGMADGYAQASGGPALVNLHTAPGVGNAMGAIFNAQANHSPLVITAGQQTRSLVTLQANLTNRDATRMPHPLVKWSFEPARAQDVPLALARATHVATLPPKGPAFVSIPMDDWDAEVDEADARAAIERKTTGRAVGDPEAVVDLARRLESASNPVLIAGPEIDASGGWEAAIALAERQQPARVRDPGPRRRTARLSRGPSELPRRPAAGDRPGLRDARRPRPDPRRRLLGLPLLPEHPGPAAARGRGAGPDHLRSRRGGAGADGRRDRRRRQADARAAARRGRRVRPRPGRVAARADRGPRGGPDHRHRGDERARRGAFPRTGSSSSRRPPRPWRCATSCGSRSPAATTSAPAAGSASGSRRRSACSSPSPTGRWSAWSARARCSTR